ncbi:hypothetical protein EsH8_XI_000123 [Colletotrichum jinshuiense]
MSDILDHVTEWRILDNILPLFVPECKGNWRLHKNDHELLNDESAEAAFKFESESEKFMFDMQLIHESKSDKGLSKPAMDSCLEAMSSLLDFLEKTVVLDRILDVETSQSEQSIPGASSPSRLENQQDTTTVIDLVYRWFDTPVGRVIANTIFRGSFSFGSTTDHSQPSAQPVKVVASKPTEPKDAFRKVIALGTLIQNTKAFGFDAILEACKDVVEWEHDLQNIQTAVDKANHTKKVFLSTQNVPQRRSIHAANYDSSRPWEISSHLYRLLSRKTCRGHQAKLQLNGFSIDPVDRSEQVKLNVFISSCPPPVISYWQEGHFKLVERTDRTELPIPDLCAYTRRTSVQNTPRRLKVNFSETDIYETPINLKYSYRSAAPTMSFANLLDQGVFRDPTSRGGLFTASDKSVLALSLGRCLLHLFYGSWIQQEWTAEAIHFLHGSTSTSDEIFEIHKPFVTCSLFKDMDADRSRLVGADYHPFLWSFAKLLIEISAGDRFPANPSDKAFIDKVYDWIDGHNGAGSRSYNEAISGCLEATKALERRRVTSGQESRWGQVCVEELQQVRSIIYKKVVGPLEVYVDGFENILQELQYRSLSLPALRKASTAPQSSASSLVFSRNSRISAASCATSISADGVTMETRSLYLAEQPSSGVIIFDDVGHPVEKTTIFNATAFFRSFEEFQRRFIMPKGANKRAGRPRIRIALLDTGVNESDNYLLGSKTTAKEYRNKQGFLFQDAQPIKEYWPSRNDARDTCGHGTNLAYLLLKFAPEADLYIAKVSSDTLSVDPVNVLGAVSWALEKNVDIISMSFGCNYYDGDIAKAVSLCLKPRDIPPPLLFAAAGNYGLNNRRAFPSSERNVICVYALDGKGGPNTINPPRHNEPNFATLGCGIELNWGSSATHKSGTSYATPIMAAIVANYLDWLGFYKGKEDGFSLEEYDQLRSEGQVRHVLEKYMTAYEPEDKLHFIAPWWLFDPKEIHETIKQKRDEKEKEVDNKTDRDIIGKIRPRGGAKPATIAMHSQRLGSD